MGLRPGADWAILAKNGTDITSMARTVARAATGHRAILREAAQPSGFAEAHYAYHGAQSWPRGGAGLLEHEADLELGYRYNDLNSVRVALESSARQGGCAAIFVGGGE